MLILGGGLMLVYAGFRGVSVIETFRAVLGGQQLPTSAAAVQIPGGPPGKTAVPAGPAGDFTRTQAPNFMGPLPS